MRRAIYSKLNWTIIICYILLITVGWVNIYAATFSETAGSLFSLDTRSGMQFLWIGAAAIFAVTILFVLSPKIYPIISPWLSIGVMILLVAVLIFGREVNGSKSWLMVAGLGIQPSEFSKITTALLLSSAMSRYGYKLSNPKDLFRTASIILVPVFLIALEPDVGTILVYCGLIFMLYREGLSGWFIVLAFLAVMLFLTTLKFSPFVSILVLTAIAGLFHTFISSYKVKVSLSYLAFIVASAFIPALMNSGILSKATKGVPVEYILIGIVAITGVALWFKAAKERNRVLKSLCAIYFLYILFIFSTYFIFDNLLKDHHRDRIENLLGISNDLQGAGYNVHQSRIAIGSGGLLGKGFLNGTQTKFDFVPEQGTDFIFCTIGEEWGFVGSLFVVIIYTVLICTIIMTAEKQKEKFNRIFGYCTASYLFVHVFTNIGMTLGIMPVVGIPLPLISYGGSSFLTFTVLIFIFLRLDIERWK